MRQRISGFVEENDQQPSLKTVQFSQTKEIEKQQFCSWTTAPNVKHFVGREQELATLNSWSQDSDCRLIVVSGMTGSGKTTLVTEFANSIKEQFDYVIWFSLSQLPSLNKLLNNYLNIINQSQLIESEPQELSFLLSEFIDCLRRERILLVLDGLQSILEVNHNSVSYKQEFEGYGQFLRSIVSTNHQSLLLTTSRIKPKLLEYYASNHVKFLDLQGFDERTTMTFLGAATDPCLVEQGLLQISKTLQHNPQLLTIANSHLDIFSENDGEQLIEDLSLLEAIEELLEQELSYLSPLAKEIVYWLAISCTAISAEDLNRQIKHSQSRLKFFHTLKSLITRSLVIEQNQTYTLMPIMKVYLRRKLVKQAL